ncbi:MAG: NACHT domain-containing protein [Candidatus Electrothrix aestuarii]|uniref:NACHT domain-containing protein n=1 Tax=Candidatus Electrothrix aestuarii TaxID=3062594 RepID=A0AAU8LVK1_9BACT|nr:NACHT domain-containing protein [Candidatus Electrothrix aestuarii]
MHNVSPSFQETLAQREFRQVYQEKLHEVYSFHEALGLMDLGEDKKISLRDIFVPLRFSREELSESRDWEDEEGTFSLLQILRQHQHIVLSGRPGSGKTTVSRMIINLLTSKALTSFTKQCGRRIPLYFKLRDYQLSSISSPEALLDQFVASQSRILEYEISREHLEFYLQQGWCFIILDGVDEVGGWKTRLRIRRFVINHFMAFHKDNYLLVTSRPAGLERVPFTAYLDKKEERAQKHLPALYYVDSFNKQQTGEFCQKWFALREENPKTVQKKADEFRDSIEKIKSLAVLKRRPVFLTMMAHIHTTKGKLPHSRAKAYEYMVDAYIEHIDITRRLHKEMYPDEHYDEWTFEDKIKLLEGIAYKLQCAEAKGKDKDKHKQDDDAVIVVSRQELLDIIKDIIQERKEGWQTIKPEHAESLLSFYLTRTGLLHEPEEERIQFSHLSFQEYLTARYIYRRVIENFFQAAAILKEEILGRLTKALFPKWSETLLLFFSLNKAATTDILKNFQNEVKELKEESEENEYFHILVMKMLDSEEYGIKDSDLGYWTRVCVEYIARADRLNERSEDVEKRSRRNKGFELVRQYFLSEDREGKVEATRDALHELFDQYFHSIQKGEYDVQEGRCLENVLYFISSPPILYNSFQEKIEEAVPVLLDRERYGLQFLAAIELFVNQVDGIADYVAAVYTIDEAIVCKDLLGKSIIHRLKKEKDEKHWLDVLLRWGMIIENLSIYSILNSLNSTETLFEYDFEHDLYVKSSVQLQALSHSANIFWRNNWYGQLWHEHIFGFKCISGKNLVRSRAYFLFKVISERTEQYRGSRSLSVYHYRNPNEATFKRIEDSVQKIVSSLDGEKDSIWWKTLAILSSANAFLYSDIEHDQDGNRYDYLWTTYEGLQHIYTLLQNPEALYEHLKEISTSIIDKPTFLEQYKEYDQKPYSMRNMAKTVLDRGKENYPDSDNDKMLKKCQEVVGRVARQVEAEKNAEAG